MDKKEVWEIAAANLAQLGMPRHITDTLDTVLEPVFVGGIFCGQAGNTVNYSSPLGVLPKISSIAAGSVAKVIAVCALAELARKANIKPSEFSIKLNASEALKHVGESISRGGDATRYLVTGPFNLSWAEVCYSLLKLSSEGLLPILRGPLHWETATRANSIQDLMLRLNMIRRGQTDWMQAFHRYVRDEMGIYGWTPLMDDVYKQSDPNLIDDIPLFFRTFTSYFNRLEMSRSDAWTAFIMESLQVFSPAKKFDARDVGYMHNGVLQALHENVVDKGLQRAWAKTGDVVVRYMAKQIVEQRMPSYYAMVSWIYGITNTAEQTPFALLSAAALAVPMYRHDEPTAIEAVWLAKYIQGAYSTMRQFTVQEADIFLHKDG